MLFFFLLLFFFLAFTQVKKSIMRLVFFTLSLFSCLLLFLLFCFRIFLTFFFVISFLFVVSAMRAFPANNREFIIIIILNIERTSRSLCLFFFFRSPLYHVRQQKPG